MRPWGAADGGATLVVVFIANAAAAARGPGVYKTYQNEGFARTAYFSPARLGGGSISRLGLNVVS